MIRKVSLSVAIILITFSLLANGWHITTEYYSLPRDHRSPRVEEVYLYKSFMKMINEDLTTVFDIGKGEIIYINTNNRTYWQGNPQRFNKEVRAELVAMIEHQLLGVEEEQREAMHTMYMEMLNATFPESGSDSFKTSEFVVQNIGEEKVGSFNTKKYRVLEQGYPLQTMWIAPELKVSKDFDFISLSHFLNQLASGAYAASFEGSMEYFSILEKGYPVKVEIRRGDGSTDVSEVTKAVNVNLNASDFAIPSGFKSGNLTEVGVWDGYL